MRKQRFLFLALVFFLCFATLFAGTTGKIMGKVVSEESGEPLRGVAVLIEGTSMGAYSDAAGKFMILNIPPGSYNVAAQLIGYQKVTQEGVQINLDQTTRLEFSLSNQVINVEGIRVSGKKKGVIQADVTSSAKIQTSEDMENMIVDDMTDVVAKSAGATGSGDYVHIRGGRSGELVYMIDGIPISDPVSGGFGMNVGTESVASSKTTMGGFSAEYGNAQSGIVNMVTKDGAEKYYGKISFQSDDWGGEPYANMEKAAFSFGGPLLTYMVPNMRDKLTFHADVSGTWTYGEFAKWQRDKLNYISTNPEISDGVFALNQYFTRDYNEEDLDWFFRYPTEFKGIDVDTKKSILGIDISEKRKNEYNYNFKIKYQINPEMKLTWGIRGNQETQIAYGRDWFLIPENYRHYTEKYYQSGLTFNHVLSEQTYYNLRFGWYSPRLTISPGHGIDQYVYRDTTGMLRSLTADPRERLQIYGVNGNVQTIAFQQSGNTVGFYAKGFDTGHWNDQTDIFTLKFDLTNQANENHQLQTGFEFKYIDVQKEMIQYPWYILDHPYNEGQTIQGLYRDVYESTPMQLGVYVSDKMEFEGMIVNAGIRLDGWNAGDYKYENYDVENFLVNSYYEKQWDPEWKFDISPRLGVSHPISDREKLHFSYTYQKQLPQLQYVYSSPNINIANSLDLVGNPELESEETIAYEVGYQRFLGEDLSLDITAFFKDISELINTVNVKDPQIDPTTGDVIGYSGGYTIYENKDYGTVKGFSIDFTKSYSNYYSGNLSYTYSWATGRSSDPRDGYDAVVASKTFMPLKEYPLDWDVRHMFSANFTYRIPQDEGPEIAGIMLDDLGLTLDYSFESGKPYTAEDINGKEFETNAERLPSQMNTDAKIWKNFHFAGLEYQVFVRGTNIFNRRNVVDVFAYTGEPDDDGHIENDPIVQWWRDLKDEVHSRLYNYGARRNIQFGVSVEF